MSRSFAEIARHPARFGALVALGIAVAVLALLIARMDTGAVHDEGLLEMDGDVVYQEGFGFNPCASSPCDVLPLPAECGPGSYPANKNPTDCINNKATFDWQDDEGNVISGEQGVCKGSGDQTGGDDPITKTDPPPDGVSDSVCVRDFELTNVSDQSYWEPSSKDFQEIFTGGSDDWGCRIQSNATNKSDIKNTYAAVAPKPGTDTDILYMGLEREVEHGSVFAGFWFLQSAASCIPAGSAACDPAATNPACGEFSGNHQTNDLLVLLEYSSGGSIGRIGAFRWIDAVDPGAGTEDDCTTGPFEPDATPTAGTSSLCRLLIVGEGDCRIRADTDELCARINGTVGCTERRAITPCDGPGSFTTPWCNDPGATTCDTVVTPSPVFAEAGIDLGAFFDEPPCFSTFLAETRSSFSTSATLKDHAVGPFEQTCAVEIRKVDGSGEPLCCATFRIFPDPTPLSEAAFLDVTDNGTGDTDTREGFVGIDPVDPGDYAACELTPPEGFISDADDSCDADGTLPDGGGCTVTVVPGQTAIFDCGDGPDPCPCPFINIQASLVIRKEAKNASTEAVNDLLCGATFEITPDPRTRETGSSLTVTDACPPDTADTNDEFGDTGGVICIDGVLPGDYTVDEVAPFVANYTPDADTPTIEPTTGTCADRIPALGDETDVSADCNAAGTECALFENTPLSEIEVIFRSLAGDGITQLETPIVCEESATDVPDDDVDGNLGDGNPPFDHPTNDRAEVFTDLEPGTYTCTIVVDP